MAVRRLLIFMFLINNVVFWGYKIYIYPYDINVDYTFDASFEALIIEASSLSEYHALTNQEYSKAAIYLPEENIIISEPFYILRKLNILRKTIIHELYHFYLTNYVKMNYKYQELYIKNMGF